jgi:peroxiredoxin
VLCASADSVFSHRVFAPALGGVPFPLLSDWNRTLAVDYGVWDEGGARPKRSVFVIDAEGVLRYENTRFNARAKADYDAVVEVLRTF